MKNAAEKIIGKKDFSSFMAVGSDIVDTVRFVDYLDIRRNGEIIEFRIHADGFLYNMVRIIVGTLIEVGTGRFSASDVEKIIEAKDRTLAGMTAPPDGLYLNRVDY